MTPLRGKSAILTGASRGIGLAIARALQRQGVRLALLSRSKPPLDAFHVPCDLGDSNSIPPAVAAALAHLGTCDFLINNAGTFLEAPVTHIPLEDWDRVLRVNLTAPFLMCRELIPHLQAHGGGRIVNIASTASTQGYLHQAAYCASKHGLLGLARSLAMETKPHNIHVYTLCPGGVDTDLIKGTHLSNRLQGQVMINPNDIAELVVFILQQPENLDLAEIVVRRFANR